MGLYQSLYRCLQRFNSYQELKNLWSSVMFSKFGSGSIQPRRQIFRNLLVAVRFEPNFENISPLAQQIHWSGAICIAQTIPEQIFLTAARERHSLS